MSDQQVTIIESWRLSYRNEIRADIQHSLNGLKPGTILRSTESAHSWRVRSRTIFIQAEGQKRFEGEREVFEHIKFMEPILENYEMFKSKIAEKESKGIHHYSLEPIRHSEKPKNHEVLNVENIEASDL